MSGDHHDGTYITVKSQDGQKRWRVLPCLTPPRSLDELESIRKNVVASRRGGGVPKNQLEPDPLNFGRTKKLCHSMIDHVHP
jgi:hypothetical protein